jgi:hypothetical protein
VSDKIFDYNQAAINEGVPKSVLDRLVNEARKEFAWDDMLMELHVIRAIKAYATPMNSNTSETETHRGRTFLC